jgi:hypothetical protein
MASVVQNKRTSESKFVTIFNDGSDGHTDVDISFREPLLSRPSDHFLVGVDNLTVNLNNLSMIEVNNSSDPDDFLFQIGRLSGETDVTAAVLTAQEVIADNHILHAGTAQAAAHPAHDPMLVNESGYIFPDAYKFRVTNTMQNVQQLAYHLNSHFAFVNDTFVRLGVQEALVHGGRTGAAVNAVAAKVIPKARDSLMLTSTSGATSQETGGCASVPRASSGRRTSSCSTIQNTCTCLTVAGDRHRPLSQQAPPQSYNTLTSHSTVTALTGRCCSESLTLTRTELCLRKAHAGGFAPCAPCRLPPQAPPL